MLSVVEPSSRRIIDQGIRNQQALSPRTLDEDQSDIILTVAAELIPWHTGWGLYWQVLSANDHSPPFT